jgi:hypothetical protein
VFQEVVEIDAETGEERRLVKGSYFHGFTYARFVPGTVNPFEWFQPGNAGQLLCASTDFSSYNQIFRLTPRRPDLLALPGPTVPPGPFELRLDAGVRQGVAILLFSGALAGEETAFANPTWPAPLWFGLDFAAGLTVSAPFVTDNFGDLTLALENPGLGGAALAVQAEVGVAAEGPLYGTSNPLLLQLD